MNGTTPTLDGREHDVDLLKARIQSVASLKQQMRDLGIITNGHSEFHTETDGDILTVTYRPSFGRPGFKFVCNNGISDTARFLIPGDSGFEITVGHNGGEKLDYSSDAFGLALDKFKGLLDSLVPESTDTEEYVKGVQARIEQVIRRVPSA